MRALAVVLVASALATAAGAGTITLTVRQRAELTEGRLVVELEVGNQGDEAALSVTPALHFGDHVARGRGTPRLAPGASFQESLSVPVGALSAGRWPYRLSIDYTDLNRYAFQTLQVGILTAGKPPPARLVPTLRSADLAGTGELTVTVKNLTDEPRDARVSVLLPDAIETTAGVRELRLDAWQEETFEVPVRNVSALVGSRHPVFVVAEYDDGPIHQTLVGRGSLGIAAVESFVARHGASLSLAGIAFLAIWLLLLVAGPLLRRPAPPTV